MTKEILAGKVLLEILEPGMLVKFRAGRRTQINEAIFEGVEPLRKEQAIFIRRDNESQISAVPLPIKGKERGGYIDFEDFDIRNAEINSISPDALNPLEYAHRDKMFRRYGK